MNTLRGDIIIIFQIIRPLYIDLMCMYITQGDNCQIRDRIAQTERTMDHRIDIRLMNQFKRDNQ